MKYTTVFKTFLAFALISISNSLFAQLSPLTLGTIKPGDSIVVYYDVTINAAAGTQVTNQGSITGTGISLVTDDPDTGAPGDATITLLNVFPLPVRLVDVNAVARGNSVELSWNVSSEEGMIRYEVERSSGNGSFKKLGEVTARNGGSASYSFIDAAPNRGTNFYRLRIIDGAAAPKYSAIVRVDMDGKNGGIKLYPNPASNGQLTVQLSNMQRGSYDLLLHNNLGQVVYRKRLEHDGGSASKTITLPQRLAKGMYSIKIMDESILLNQLIMIQ